MIKTVGAVVNRMLRPFGLEMRRARYLRIPQMERVHVARFLYLKRVFELINDVEGDIVECGVGPGNSLLFLSHLVKDEMKGRKIWGFDSFEGFPEPSSEDKSIRNPKPGEWSDTSVHRVLDLLLDAGLDRDFVLSQVTLVKGFFEESLHKYRGSAIALLHIDVDLYDSYRMVLEQLYPKVALGGVVLFDEYLETLEHLYFPGAQKAIDEFLKEDKHLIRRDQVSGKYYMIRQQ